MQTLNSSYIFVTENFAFLILRVFELFTRKACKMFVYKHTKTTEYVKNQLTFQEKTLRENNLIIFINTSHYCPLAITKELVQLMLQFFRYSSLSSKMVAMFVNIEKCKKQKPLEPSHCKEAITRNPFQSDTNFLTLILPYPYLVRIRKSQFFFGKLLTYPGRRYNDTSSFQAIPAIIFSNS